VGFRLPIKNPQAVAAGQGAVFIDNVQQEGLAGGGLGHIHPHLAHHHRFSVTGDHVIRVGLALGVQRCVVGGRGIKGHPNNVPIGTSGLQAVKHPAEEGVVVAVGNMDDHLGVGLHGLDRAVAAVDQLGEAGEPVDRHPSPWVTRVHRPQHAVVGLVSHLDPLGMDPCRRQGAQHIVGVN